MSAPVGMWLAASRVHGRPVRVGDPYPHICHHRVPVAGQRWAPQIGSRGCIACAEKNEPRGVVIAFPELNTQAVDRAEEQQG